MNQVTVTVAAGSTKSIMYEILMQDDRSLGDMPLMLVSELTKLALGETEKLVSMDVVLVELCSQDIGGGDTSTTDMEIPALICVYPSRMAKSSVHQWRRYECDGHGKVHVETQISMPMLVCDPTRHGY